VCCDLNIAHKEQDLKNFKGNKNNSGFLPQEREWLSQFIEKQGVIDVYRHLHPSTTDECYTWWSNRGQAYAKNVGWRLDYHLATSKIAHAALHTEIYKEEKFSDHAPLIMQYDNEAFGLSV
jgi:exodeoxyribonuclease-3